MTTSTSWLEGTYRVLPPSETWARIQPLMVEAGVTRVADLTHLDSSGIPVHSAARPRATTHVMSQGKGVTPLLSKVSAVMESLEMWFAEQPREPDLRAVPAAELGGVVDYPLEALDLTDPTIVTAATPLDWTDALTIAGGIPTAVPTRCVGMDRRAGERWEAPSLTRWTNGLASGNNLVEALHHALCEITERDAIAGAAPDITARPIRASSLADPTLDGLVDLLLSTGNELMLYDLGGSLEVPCVAAMVRSDEAGGGRFAGFGCHPDRGVAACRAVTEAVQNRVAFITGTRDDLPAWRYGQAEVAGVEPPRPPDPGPPAAEAPLPPVDSDLSGHLDGLVGRITARTGFAPCYVSLTPDDCPIRVVRVVAPGLGSHTLAGLR
jgi:ribosomal protein S12 methylthiotransferase accessory factor